MPSSVAVMISDDVGVVFSMSAGRFAATAKLATRLNIMSAWAGSETVAASAAVRTKSAEWRGTGGVSCSNGSHLICGNDISKR
jgi:hypothetical protein